MNQIIIQYNGGAFANEGLRPLIDSAIELELSSVYHHFDPYYYMNIAKLYDIQYALSGKEGYYSQAEEYFKRAIEVMPKRQDISGITPLAKRKLVLSIPPITQDWLVRLPAAQQMSGQVWAAQLPILK